MSSKGSLIKKGRGINPFVRNAGFEALVIRTTKDLITTESIPRGNEIVTHPDGSTKIRTGYKLDKEESVKVYLSAETKQLYMAMTLPGRKLLDLIMFKLRHNEDQVNIKVSAFAKSMNCSARTVYNGIEELRKLSFITKDKGSSYWINPHFFFKGNRLFAYGDDFVHVKATVDRNVNVKI